MKILTWFSFLSVLFHLMMTIKSILFSCQRSRWCYFVGLLPVQWFMELDFIALHLGI